MTSNYGQEVEDLLFETIPGSDYFSKDVNGNITVDYGAIATNPDFIEGFINLTSSLQGSTLELEKTIDSIPISLGSPITVQPFDFSVADVNNIAYFNNTYNATVSVYLDFYDNETGKAYSNFVNVPPNESFSICTQNYSSFGDVFFISVSSSEYMTMKYPLSQCNTFAVVGLEVADGSICVDLPQTYPRSESICIDYPKAMTSTALGQTADVIGGLGSRAYENTFGADLLGVPEINEIAESWAKRLGLLTGVPTDTWSTDVSNDTTWDDVKEQVNEKEVEKENESEVDKELDFDVPIEGVKDNSIDFSPLMVVTQKFPFSIPWDVVYLIELFNVGKECPTFKFDDIKFNALGGTFIIPGFEVNFEKDVPGWNMLIGIEKFFISLFYTFFMVTKIRDFMKS